MDADAARARPYIVRYGLGLAAVQIAALSAIWLAGAQASPAAANALVFAPPAAIVLAVVAYAWAREPGRLSKAFWIGAGVGALGGLGAMLAHLFTLFVFNGGEGPPLILAQLEALRGRMTEGEQLKAQITALEGLSHPGLFALAAGASTALAGVVAAAFISPIVWIVRGYLRGAAGPR